ncbi:MAG: HAMP domain-containing histidine kinase [Gammaproteobacteria bacterium]|nr:HAMP domain-containing histidine kinase [Gammaproteobacteria bacterium]
MEYPTIRRRDGRFDDTGLERAFVLDSWPGIRLQAALTLIGFSISWFLSTSSDFAYLQGTPYFLPTVSARISCGLFGAAVAGWLLWARPGSDSRWAHLATYVWMIWCFITVCTVASVYPLIEATPDGRSDVLVFTSYWMSIQIVALGIALANYSWGVAAMSVGYATLYTALALFWGDQLQYVPYGQTIMLVSGCFFGWIMTVVFSNRARRRFHITRLYEDAKVAAEKSQEFSAFLLAATGHDIRQPVYALDLNAGMLEDLVDRQEWDKVKIMAGRQRLVARNVASMLSSVLELSYLDSSKREVEPKVIKVDELLDNVCLPLADITAQRGMTLRRVRSPAEIKVDPGVVEHILSNLLSNAITHSKGSRLLVGTRSRGSRGVEIIVMDDGEGLSDVEVKLSSVARLTAVDKDQALRSGLGMEIMFRLAERGGVDLLIWSRPESGVMACLICPKA